MALTERTFVCQNPELKNAIVLLLFIYISLPERFTNGRAKTDSEDVDSGAARCHPYDYMSVISFIHKQIMQ